MEPHVGWGAYLKKKILKVFLCIKLYKILLGEFLLEKMKIEQRNLPSEKIWQTVLFFLHINK